jgi:hypothetical protein
VTAATSPQLHQRIRVSSRWKETGQTKSQTSSSTRVSFSDNYVENLFAPLKHTDFYMYHLLWHQEALHFANRV